MGPNKTKERKMDNKENLQNLFSVLNGCLPREYTEAFFNDKGTHASMLIVKENSDRIMQISTSELNDGTFTVFVYDDGDDPAENSEVYLWDTDSPDFTLDNILAAIKNSF